MMYTFKSCFASQIEDFIAQKNALGFGYLESSRLLRDFDRFCLTHFPEENTLTKELCLGHEKGYRRQQYLPQPYDAGAGVCQILKPQRRSCLHSAARHCQERCAVCPVHLHRGRNPGHLGCFRPLETERWFPGTAICDPSYDKADVLLRSASI